MSRASAAAAHNVLDAHMYTCTHVHVQLSSCFATTVKHVGGQTDKTFVGKVGRRRGGGRRGREVVLLYFFLFFFVFFVFF